MFQRPSMVRSAELVDWRSPRAAAQARFGRAQLGALRAASSGVPAHRLRIDASTSVVSVPKGRARHAGSGVKCAD